MKKALSVLCAILLVSALAVTAFAEAVPSPAVDVPEVIEIVVTDKDGNVVDIEINEMTLSVVPYESKDQLSEETKATLEQAYAILDEADSIEEVIPECAGKEVLGVVAVEVSEEIAQHMENGGTVSVTLDMKVELAAGTRIQLVRFVDGQWVLSDDYAEVLEDGTVVMHLSQPGCYALLVD